MNLQPLTRFFKRQATQTVMGHKIPEPRPTWQAAAWLMLVLGLPVFLLGMVVDGLIQWATGQCTGVWCYFGG